MGGLVEKVDMVSRFTAFPVDTLTGVTSFHLHALYFVKCDSFDGFRCLTSITKSGVSLFCDTKVLPLLKSATKL